MKKTLVTCLIGLAALMGNAQDNTRAVGGPMIQLDKDVHDYGIIPLNGNGECTFTVTNTGDAPLILTNCKGSCGCTVPKCDTEPIPPGGKSSITVKYDTKREGPINKSVTISSNASNEPEKTVRIKGHVQGAGGVPGSTPTPQ